MSTYLRVVSYLVVCAIFQLYPHNSADTASDPTIYFFNLRKTNINNAPELNNLQNPEKGLSPKSSTHCNQRCRLTTQLLSMFQDMGFFLQNNVRVT